MTVSEKSLNSKAAAVSLVIATQMLLAGCSANDAPSLADATGLITNALAPTATTKVEGTPSDVYTKIAKRANACWYKSGANVLDKYTIHASATPDKKKANISIHEATSSGGRGPLAFNVILQDAEQNKTALSFNNQKLSENLAANMENDVRRWAEGQDGCHITVAKASTKPAAKTTEPKTNTADKSAGVPLPQQASAVRARIRQNTEKTVSSRVTEPRSVISQQPPAPVFRGSRE